VITELRPVVAGLHQRLSVTRGGGGMKYPHRARALQKLDKLPRLSGGDNAAIAATSAVGAACGSGFSRECSNPVRG